MTLRTYETTLALDINGHSCELPVVLHYDHQRASGDGFHEPFCGESVSLERVECFYDGNLTRSVQLLPMLDAQYIRSLEYMLLQSAQRETRASQHAEWKRETEWEGM